MKVGGGEVDVGVERDVECVGVGGEEYGEVLVERVVVFI